MKNPFIVGQHVKYMPPHRTDGELYEYAARSGLSPRKLYCVLAIDGEFVVVDNELRDHFTCFRSGDLDHKLGQDDNSWEAQKKRMEERHGNYFKST